MKLIRLKYNTRFLKSALTITFLFVLFVINMGTASFATPGVSAKDKTQEPKIVMITLPRVTWELLKDADTPNIDKLIEQGSVAALSVKTQSSVYSPSEGYATIGAGSRAGVDTSVNSQFVIPSEIFNGRLASEIFTEQRGPILNKNPVGLGLSFEKTINNNSRSLNNAKIGSLAEALKVGSRSIAVFGNADDCLTDAPGCYSRSISYLGTNFNGELINGDISRDLLEKHDGAKTTQLFLDNDIVAKKTIKSLNKNDVTATECSDLERVESMRSTTKDSISEENFRKAIEKCDQLIGMILPKISMTNDQIYILAPSSPVSLPNTTVFIAAGKNIPSGYASSSTTRAKAIVSLVDIAPTILQTLNVAKGDAMSDTLIQWEKSESSLNVKENFLIKINDQAKIREKVISPIAWFLLIVFCLCVLIALVSFTREGKWKQVAIFTSLITMSFPLVTFAIQPIMIWLSTPLNHILFIALATSLISLLMMWAGNKWDYTKVIFGFSITFLVVFIVDIGLGGKLQFNSAFGNATMVAGRFAGWGNSAFAFVAIFTIIAVAMFKQLMTGYKVKQPNKYNIYIMGALLVVLIFDGAPYFGSDVGGVLALTPALFVISMMLYEKRVGIKAVLLSTVLTIGAISTFALIDLNRPVSHRTHLGRFAESLLHGDATVTLERKMIASLNSFTRPALSISTIMAVLFFLYIVFSSSKYFKETYSSFISMRYIVLPGVIVAILGLLLNDSGLSIPSNIAIVAIPVITILILNRDKKQLPNTSSNEALEKSVS